MYMQRPKNGTWNPMAFIVLAEREMCVRKKMVSLTAELKRLLMRDDLADMGSKPGNKLPVLETATALAVSFGICKVATYLTKSLRIQGGNLPFVTAIVAILATMFPAEFGRLAPAGETLAMILMQRKTEPTCRIHYKLQKTRRRSYISSDAYAKRRRMMIAALPKLFNMIRLMFNLDKCNVITKQELMQRIISGNVDIVDRAEFEEQLKLLQELVPDWISEKTASSGDHLFCCSQLLESLHLPNIKWICPTAPTRPVAAFVGFPCTAWFDVGELSADGPDDVVGLDAAAAHVENLLSTEPSDSLLTAVRRDHFQVLNYKEVLFNDFGDRVAQLLHINLVRFHSQNRTTKVNTESLLVNTHLLFPHNSGCCLHRLLQVYKILQYIESYCKEYHQFTDSDAHKWVSHRNHRGNICGVDFIWLLNPNNPQKPLKESFIEAILGNIKNHLREVSATCTDQIQLKTHFEHNTFITYPQFYEAFIELGFINHPSNGLSIDEIKDLWDYMDTDRDGVVTFSQFDFSFQVESNVGMCGSLRCTAT